MNQRVPRNPPATAMQGERKITVPASQDRPPGMPLFERPRVPPLVKARDSLTLESIFKDFYAALSITLKDYLRRD